MFKKSKGQSLVETMVALTIIVVGIMGAVSLGIYTIRVGYTSLQDVVAESLLREGVEAIRMVRDYNWIQEEAWNNDLVDGNYRVNMGVAGNPSGGDPDPGAAPPEVSSAFGGGIVEYSTDQGLSLKDNFYKLCYKDGQYIHSAAAGVAECGLIPPEGAWEESGFSRMLTLKTMSSAEHTWIRVEGQVLRQGVFGSKVTTIQEDIYDWWQ